MFGLMRRKTWKAAETRRVSAVLMSFAVIAGLLAALITAEAQAQSGPIVVPEPADGAGPAQPTRPRVVAPGTPLVEEIIVEGARRIDPETVRTYLAIGEGDPFDPQAVNDSLKNIFATGLFADVTISREGDNLVVRVVENPIINRIAFEGNQRITDAALQAEVQLRPRVVYTRTRVQEDVNRILAVYRRSGRFAVTVEPKVIQLEQNRVDLAFEISEGEVTGIEQISFIGNKFFSDSALKAEVATKETRWYRFLTSNDTYDPDRLTFDRELLRRFYLANGFVDFRVISTVAELSEDRENFFITVTLEEGERYNFGTFSVFSEIEEVDPEPLQPVIELESGDYYDADAVDEAVLALTDAVGELGYAFVEVRPVVNRDRENRIIDIEFRIGEAPKVYVERIDIRGNVRTLDRVIRREFELVEGDAFNSAKLRRSRNRIRGLGFFESVDVKNVPGAAGDRTVIEVDVTEQSTGELSIGAGFSSDAGALGEVSVRERNLLGRGQDLRATIRLAQEETGFDISFTEPYFLGRDLSAGIDAFHSVVDAQDESSFDLQRSGGGVRLGYNINREWSQQLFYRLSIDDVQSVDSDASPLIQAEAGENTRSIIGQTLTLDRRNSRIDPTDGYTASLTTDYAGVGGGLGFARFRLGGTYFQPVYEEVRAVLSAETGFMFGVGDDVRVSDRFTLGGANLRGFEAAGVGPRDVATDDALGGQQFARGSVELLFPLGLPEELGINGAAFSDFGTLTEIDNTNSNVEDSGNLRASVGVGIGWASPFGPIRVDFAKAVVKDGSDQEEFFRFNFGTQF
ncbi:MAG: outer membrane protein assembly factor BamA [Alphaproteobacteria bacterium]|nr:outer membrane protein assembly factor BamA [Alphaproteobacteria bacterium]